MKTLSEAMEFYGGVLFWIQIFVVIVILALSVHKFILYYGVSGPKKLPFWKSHDAILFLGVFNFAWGMFTQLTGIIIALNMIIEAADISPQLVFTGLRNSFIAPLLGMISMLVSALIWALLQGRYTKIQRSS